MAKNFKRMKQHVKYDLKSYLIFLPILIFILGACGDKENIVVFTYSEAIRLLSNDSAKSWERKTMFIDGQSQEMPECDLYTNTEYISRNDSLIFITTSIPDFCSGNSEILDSGYWDVLEESIISDRIDRVAYYSVDGDTTYKKVLEITSLFLTLESDAGNSTIQESFEYTIPY
jgi:hypothetical protein